MKKRRLMWTVAAAVMAVSMLGGYGGLGTQNTTGVGTTAAKAEEGNTADTTAAGTAAATDSAPAVEKNYNSTFDLAGAGDVSLDVMITFLGDSDGGLYLRGVMDDYMTMYPSVKLIPVECSMNDLYTTLITRAMAGTLPDIFTMTEVCSASCLEMGMSVSNMDQPLSEGYLNGLTPAAVENVTVNDALVYMPWQNNITAMVYRKDLFKKRGIGISKAWEQFLEAARALTEDLDGDDKTNRYSCAFAGTRNDSVESRLQTFTLTYGCDFATDSRSGTFTSGFGTPGFKNAMTSFVNMAANQGVTPPGLIGTGYSEVYTMIAADQAYMFFSAPNVLGGIYNANPEMRGKVGSFPMPTAEGVDPMTSFSSVGMTVNSTCKNPEVAADFLKHMTSVENSVTWNEATCRLPVVNNTLTAICKKGEAYAGFAEASDSAVIYPAFAGLAELRDICGECWQTVVSENASIDDVIVAVAAKAEEVVTSYNN